MAILYEYNPVELTAAELEWLRDRIQHDDVAAFYNWGKWRKQRAYVLEQDKRECQMCKAKGRYSKAAIVHHVKHLREYPQYSLTMWVQYDGVWVRQLVSLCADCHEECHPERLRQYQKQKRGYTNEERWD